MLSDALEFKKRADEAQYSFNKALVWTKWLIDMANQWTRESAIQYATNLKYVMQNAQNPKSIIELSMLLPSSKKNMIAEELSLIKTTDNWTKLKQAESLDFDPRTSYDSVWIDEIIEKSKKYSETLWWLSDRRWDGTLRYFNKIDWWRYMLNNEWFAKLNVVEESPLISVYREMWSVDATQQKFLNTIKKIPPWQKLHIPADDISKIEWWNMYDMLLSEINKFIPCI